MIDMKKGLTIEIYLEKHKKIIMMCCMAMNNLLGMGGPPM